MNMSRYYITVISFLFTFWNLQSQQKPTLIIQSEPVQYVEPLSAQKKLLKPVKKEEEINPKRRSGQNIIVPGKGFPKGIDPLLQNRTQTTVHDSNSPILTFEATHYGGTPSDPTGAVGPDHYVVAYNIAFKIFDKNGTVLINDTSLKTLFPNHESDGDPIVLYDSFADRFLITEFDITASPNKLLVAVSQTSDPVNGGWYIYAFDIEGGMPDYPKFSIWSDGYYITVNKNANTADTSEVIYVMERDKMINGEQAQMLGFPLPGISVNGFYSPSGFNVEGAELPPTGNAPIVYLQDDSWSGVDDDHLKIWYVNVDWENPSSSTISDNPDQIITSDFNSVFDNGSFSNLPQPNGVKIDALQATIMFMTNYRRFDGYNSVVLNFVVNTDNQGKAGIRWFELRQQNDGDPWQIYQEGTFVDPSGHNTFAGSINIDGYGNIGLGYTIVDTDQVPELHYTGRYAADPLGQMTIEPQTIVPGGVSDPSERYGDYAQLTVDPVDNKTFWFISEYFESYGRVDQVCVFKFQSDYDNDVGVSEIIAPSDAILSNNETITVKITNYGLTEQSNFPVQYQIDGGSIVTENFTETIQPGESVEFSFATKADLSEEGRTYTITVATRLSGDQDETNDSATKQVKDLYKNDMGIVSIDSPQSGSNLSDSEPVTVLLRNFGGLEQENVPVSYTFEGNTVTETAPGPYAPNSEQFFTFSQTVNLYNVGTYQLSASTHLEGDSDPSNDSVSIQIDHNMCQPQSDCSDGDYFSNVKFNTINKTSACSYLGYADYSDISTDVLVGRTYDLSATVNYTQDHFSAWIDFNDNFLFEEDELIIDDYIFGEGMPSEEVKLTEVFPIEIPEEANLGEHLMRLRLRWNDDASDPCSNFEYGETEDYKVNIINPYAHVTKDTMVVYTSDQDNSFLIELYSPDSDEKYLEVFTTQGKRLVYYPLNKANNRYSYNLNMNYVAKGVYLVRIGNENGGSLAKIIVK